MALARDCWKKVETPSRARTPSERPAWKSVVSDCGTTGDQSVPGIVFRIQVLDTPGACTMQLYHYFFLRVAEHRVTG